MKKSLLLVAFFLLFTSGLVNAQSIDKISARCPSPNQSTFANVIINNLGDVVHTPCNARSSIFNGLVDFTNATVTGVVTGSGTANHVPRFTAASVIGNTPQTWNGTVYTFQNTAETGLGTMAFTPNAAVGSGTFVINSGSNFTIDFGVTTPSAVVIGDPLGTGTGSNLQLLSTGGVTLRTAAAQNLDIGQAANRILIRGATADLITNIPTWDLSNSVLGGVLTFKLNRTITAAGTTGNQTINKPNGQVNFAAAGVNLTVTNSTVTATSTIILTAQKLDATCLIFVATSKAAGSFHIETPVGCTTETPVAFWVFN